MIQVFTDGGCINNGAKNAKASYAVYIINKVIRGHVLPYEYTYYDNTLKTTTSINICPSNNRGELLSLVKAFIEIDKLNDIQSKYVVYSDSQICVKTINEWYNNRLKKGTVNQFKNFDLIKIMMYLYNKIKETKDITVVHIRGHQSIKKCVSQEQKNIINGNIIVDRYAYDILNKHDVVITDEIIEIYNC